MQWARTALIAHKLTHAQTKHLPQHASAPPYCACAAAAVLVVLELTVFPFLLLAGLTANLSTAVQAMKEAQAARTKKMFWVDTPVSAGRQAGRRRREGMQTA